MKKNREIPVRFKNTTSLLEKKLENNLIGAVIGEYPDINDIKSVQLASKTMHTLFQPTANSRQLDRLLAAVFMGEETLAEQIVKINPNLLFERGTYKMPLLNENGTLSNEHEQIYYDVTPFLLSLYTGDFNLWMRLVPLIPQQFVEQARDEMRLILRGGPDLVKINKDPSTIPFKDLKQFSLGKLDRNGKPIIYDLLCNPDGIIYYKAQFFYANQDTQKVTLLKPNVLPEDIPAFEQFKNYLSLEMLMNSSKRTSDIEHALIKRTFGQSLERNGIHYELNGVSYQDTYDGCIRLINANRQYEFLYNRLQPRSASVMVQLKHIWMNNIAKTQRVASVCIIQRYCEDNMPFYPMPSDEVIKSGLKIRSDVISINKCYLNVYPLKRQCGIGFEFGLQKKHNNHCEGSNWAVNIHEYDLPTILQIASIEKACKFNLMQTLENRLYQLSGHDNFNSKGCTVS